MRRRLPALAAAAVLVLAGCGRELPDAAGERVPAGGDEVGAFEELGELSGRVETDGLPLVARFLAVAAREFHATGDSLLRFEVEAFLQFVLDHEEELAREAGVEPLTLEELQETTTAFEKALAGIG